MSTETATKELLIERITEVFIERGYDGATLTNLAAATSLSKASLYHHFPGGKPEMAAILIRHAIAKLQRFAFAQLTAKRSPAENVAAFIDGFARYVGQGQSDCLLAVFIHHGTAREQATRSLQADIATQFEDWHVDLANVYVAAGRKPKRARRQAHDLIAALYGALLNAKMHNQPALFTDSIERMTKQLKRSGL